jgi:hypothetical protein
MNEKPELKTEIPVQSTESKPVEFSEDSDLESLESEGKSSKMKIVENKELGVRYKETIIELPEHRQKETGINRIRRRELLPPLPNGLFTTSEESEYYLPSRENSNKTRQSHYNAPKELDDLYKFITDGIYPSETKKVHIFDFGLLGSSMHNRDYPHENEDRMKKEGLYFQKIFLVPDEENNYDTDLYKINDDATLSLAGSYEKVKEWEKLPEEKKAGIYHLYCTEGRMWGSEYNTPVFIFGNKNKAFVQYLNSLLNHPIYSQNQKYYDTRNSTIVKESETIQSIINGEANKHASGMGRFHEENIPSVKHPDIKPLRWCHADLALVPTKRSLNILFFETD